MLWNKQNLRHLKRPHCLQQEETSHFQVGQKLLLLLQQQQQQLVVDSMGR
jgi:hypothetical protein